MAHRTAPTALHRLAVLVAAVVLVGACGGGGDDASADGDAATTVAPTTAPATTAPDGSSTTTTAPDRSTTTAPPPTTAPPSTTAPPHTAAPPPTTAPPTTAPPSTEPPPPAPEVLEPGDEGPAVELLQTRLRDLGYWVGPVDATYGTLTEQAVFAFQKAQGLAVDGVTGPSTRTALEAPAPVRTRTTSGTAWEVDKTRQLLILAVDGRAVEVHNTSTGTEDAYTYDGRERLADTPEGDFTLDWQVDGVRDGALGRLYRPKYFHPDGIAIHGYGSVPPVPASHGCVRITKAAMDHVWADGRAPLGTRVLVYGDSPV
ncbi:L,D-transpeptidase family protein [Iamia majanohamensis]|uniref:L,D-transpeptidase family protein n=1 Tax=Iamia majanohamensis TaxID=467976 RepID=A0AAE9YAG8_9ACTN|nr:L,D-transpeptidase family protein [Iamia majanohamensis]WCO68836.1 L,D-transpeptidase family protein [Iamia majanohamensis]